MPDSPGGEEARISRILSKKAKRARKDSDGEAARLHPGRLRRPGWAVRGRSWRELRTHLHRPHVTTPCQRRCCTRPPWTPGTTAPRCSPGQTAPSTFFLWLDLPEKSPKGLGLLSRCISTTSCIFTTPEPLFSTRNPKEKKMLVIRKASCNLLEERGKEKTTWEKQRIQGKEKLSHL